MKKPLVAVTRGFSFYLAAMTNNEQAEHTARLIDDHIESKGEFYQQFKKVALLGRNHYEAFRMWQRQMFGTNSHFRSASDEVTYISRYGPVEILFAPGPADRIEVYYQL